MGRYNRLQPVQLPMVTSSNQKLVIFKRYTSADFALPSVEITIDAAGESVTTGFPILGEFNER
jgi:hypothetical protein